MYRSVALYCIQNGIDTENISAVERALDYIKIELKYKNNEQNIYLNGVDVTSDIRRQEVAKGASDVATIKKVREVLVDMQKKFADYDNIVMDGRDVGTCVLPNADVKIYMDADVSERTKRRCNELKEKGIEFDFDKIKQEIIDRDESDKNREFSPLRKADDAILYNSTDKGIDEVTSDIIAMIKNVKNNYLKD